jgi:hypothetical protein
MLDPTNCTEQRKYFIVQVIQFICSPSPFGHFLKITWWWPIWAETCCELIIKNSCLCNGNPFIFKLHKIGCFCYIIILTMSNSIHINMHHYKTINFVKCLTILGKVWSTEPITVAAPSKIWTVFARSDTEIVGSNPTQGMDVCVRLFCVCVVLCTGSGLATGWSTVQGVLPTAYGLRNCRAKQSFLHLTLGPHMLRKHAIYKIHWCSMPRLN